MPCHKMLEVHSISLCLIQHNPAGIYLLKVNNRNTRTRCEICSTLTVKTPERRQSHFIFWFLYCERWTYLTPCSSVSVVNFEYAIAGWKVISDQLTGLFPRAWTPITWFCGRSHLHEEQLLSFAPVEKDITKSLNFYENNVSS